MTAGKLNPNNFINSYLYFLDKDRQSFELCYACICCHLVIDGDMYSVNEISLYFLLYNCINFILSIHFTAVI